jgi:Mg-chelatase subunit ChlD
MQLSCIHCGSEFSISAEQLGGRGQCPHCHGVIDLPNAVDENEHRPHEAPSNWLESSVSMLGSTVFHLIIVMILALSLGECQGPGISSGTEEVVIGEVPSENLDEPTKEELKQEEAGNDGKTGTETLSNPLDEITSPAVSESAREFQEIPISPLGGVVGISGPESLDGPRVGGPGPKGSFEIEVQRLRHNGLDIVLSFDSTGSMAGEINEVKRQIERVGVALMKLVPKTRISICTYRDDGDAYVVKGLPLTNDIKQIKSFLDDINAGGGGDLPEAVHEGLRWPLEKNMFEPKAHKVILLFGDAPPHMNQLKTCLELASDFKTNHNGLVSTVTCRQRERLPELVKIAEEGGGEAFLTSNERQIMTQLLVLVFGSQHRSKVLEAFDMRER